MIKRGRVLRDTNSGPGLMTVEGIQYSFVLEKMWRSEIPPRPGMPVDVTFGQDGIPESVAAVSEGQAHQEEAGGPIGRDKAGRSGFVKNRIASRFGIEILIAEIIILLSFFMLPNLTVGSSYSTTGLSGWDATGLSATTMSATDHGFLSLLAVVCLCAPLAVPFLTQSRARWLNAAPIGFAVAASVVLTARIDGAGQEASRGMTALLGSGAGREMSGQVSAMFHISFGAYLVLLCSIYLLTHAFRRPT